MGVLTVVGLGGSMRAGSASRAALEAALTGAARAGGKIERFDVRELGLPMYVPDMNPPTEAQTLAKAASKAQAMVWSSPMYHGSVSGSFKNAVDWLQLLSAHDPPYLTDKVIGLITTAGGSQGLQAVNTMEFIVRALRAWAVPLVLPVARAWEVFDEAGVLRDTALRVQLEGLGAEVVRAAGQMADLGTCDYAEPRAGTRAGT
ncbi:MAG: NADPH-dependent FMN reductase [Streptomycetales bacterium]